MAIAHGGLRHLRDERLGIAQQQGLQEPTTMELSLELLRIDHVYFPESAVVAMIDI
jgi:hypothetical protein